MNCLFLNFDRGAGVELIGDMFIDILSRFDLIDNIDVWTSQCVQESNNFNLDYYDLVFCNDPSPISVAEQNIMNKIADDSKVFAISHGTLSNMDFDYSGIFELNFEYNCQNYSHPSILNQVFPLKFIPGNIWKNNIDSVKRIATHMLFVGRICEEKLPLDIIKVLYNNQIILDVYGPIVDKKYFENASFYFNYLGNKTHIELVDVYNNYQFFLMASKTECLSMPIREALSCGCRVYVVDNNGFTNSISNYVTRVTSAKEFDDMLHGKFKSKESWLDAKDFNNEFTFDKMVLQFLIYLRGLLGKHISYSDNPCNIKFLTEERKREKLSYSYDIVNWNKVLK